MRINNNNNNNNNNKTPLFKLGGYRLIAALIQPFILYGQKVNGYYLGIMKQFQKKIITKKTIHCRPGSWYFSHHNTPPHKTLAVNEFLSNKQVPVVHLQCSRDVPPCSYEDETHDKRNMYDDIEAIKVVASKVIESTQK